MHCCGHSRCALCNIPVCPDAVDDCESEDIETKKYIDKYKPHFNWMMDAVVIYKDGSVYDVTDNELCAIINSSTFHNQYANTKTAIFLHNYCYHLILTNHSMLPVNNLWLFLATYAEATTIQDITSKYNPCDSLSQYYTNNNIWLIHNPLTNEQNRSRIFDRFQLMLTAHESDKKIHN
jgi:hypothetical protein